MAKEKVVLAYSGGLDTTCIIPWLKENYNYDVVCCCINVGQEQELDGLEERARYCGADKLYILDVIDEFCDEYVAPCIQAHAVYENKYLIGTSMARPLIAKKLVEVARKEGAVAICHGATGKGNDQIRFELGIKALAPDLKIIAAWRDPNWKLDSRESEIEYAHKHGIDLPFSQDESYSRDRNLWHISHEGLELEDPSNEPNYEHLLVLSKTPQQAPDKTTYLTIDFEKGIPVAVNGEKMKLSDIIRKLNKLGGENGIGIVDIVENRVVGMKSRGVYETPGGTILYEAHQQLEELCLAGIHREHPALCNGYRKARALQRQYYPGRRDFPVLDVQRIHRFVQDRRYVRSYRCERLYQSVRTFHQGPRNEAAGSREKGKC